MNIFCSVKIKKSDLPCKGKKEIGKSINNENFFEESDPRILDKVFGVFRKTKSRENTSLAGNNRESETE